MRRGEASREPEAGLRTRHHSAGALEAGGNHLAQRKEAARDELLIECAKLAQAESGMLTELYRLGETTRYSWNNSPAVLTRRP